MNDDSLELNNIIKFYSNINEHKRLSSNIGQLEFIRTKEIIEQYLKFPPLVVIDVGGASGQYSFWLAKKGYEVHLIDSIPLHIKQTLQSSHYHDYPLSSCKLGNARKLEFPDSSADIILMLGPLYHLVNKSDRIIALKESFRVLKNGGTLFAAGISRFACIGGLMKGFYKDPEYKKIMLRDLKTGQHRNHTNNQLYFTDAFFHRPEELKYELEQAEFNDVNVIAIEGIGYMLKDFDEAWNDSNHRNFILKVLTKIDKEPSIIGASPHILAIGAKL